MELRKSAKINGAKNINVNFIPKLSQKYPNVNRDTLVMKIYKAGSVEGVELNGSKFIPLVWDLIRLRFGGLTKVHKLCYYEEENIIFWHERYFVEDKERMQNGVFIK